MDSDAVPTRCTPGSRSRALARSGANTVRLRSDGLVLARNVANEAWVRRAAATEPIATPPVSPISSTIAR
jgi:hypothetical protein